MPAHVTDVTGPKRINVAITPQALADLDLVIRTEGVTLTEAARRLLGYGAFMYRSARENGNRLIEEDGETGAQKEIILL